MKPFGAAALVLLNESLMYMRGARINKGYCRSGSGHILQALVMNAMKTTDCPHVYSHVKIAAQCWYTMHVPAFYQLDRLMMLKSIKYLCKLCSRKTA